jgi:hypothetical protein
LEGCSSHFEGQHLPHVSNYQLTEGSRAVEVWALGDSRMTEAKGGCRLAGGSKIVWVWAGASERQGFREVSMGRVSPHVTHCAHVSFHMSQNSGLRMWQS